MVIEEIILIRGINYILVQSKEEVLECGKRFRVRSKVIHSKLVGTQHVASSYLTTKQNSIQ